MRRKAAILFRRLNLGMGRASAFLKALPHEEGPLRIIRQCRRHLVNPRKLKALPPLGLEDTHKTKRHYCASCYFE